MTESQKVRLTGLWKKEPKGGGDSYLEGAISPTSRLLIFHQKGRKSDKEPEYIAYLAPARPKDQKADRAEEASF